MTSTELSFEGATFDQKRDGKRLTGQIGRIFRLMKDEKWRTFQEIQTEIFQHTHIIDPIASISAQLRNLRKDRNGGHTVERRTRKGYTALYEYQLKTNYWTLKDTPKVIKEPDLIEYHENRAVLTRFVPKVEWRKIDADLRSRGYTKYFSPGIWVKP